MNNPVLCQFLLSEYCLMKGLVANVTLETKYKLFAVIYIQCMRSALDWSD